MRALSQRLILQKTKLVKQYRKVLAILVTIALIAYPLIAGAYKTETSEPTYEEEVPVETASTTQIIVEDTPVRPTSVLPTGDVVDKIITAFPDAPIMVWVAICESELNPTADRANLNVDVGLFQINQVHLPELNRLGLDRRNVDDNIAYAKILYNESGLGPWYMSKHCWEKYL